MKKNFVSLGLGILLISVFCAFTYIKFYEADTFKTDVKSSSIQWTAYKVTGQHKGNIFLKSGDVQIANGKLTGGAFEVDMNSITCTDLSGTFADKLTGHLKSDDFFSAAKFPTAKLLITKVEPKENGMFAVTADLTLKGITKPITFDANVNTVDNIATATANIKVNRTHFDIKYGSGSFFDNLGDKAISDEFDLVVNLKANK